MSARVKVEAAALPHTDIIAALHAACFEDPWTSESISGLLATPGTAGWIASVADGEGQEEPVGFLLVRAAAGEAEILSIGVVPAARGQRVASRLIDAAVEQLQASALFLDVAADNRAALKLYEREGFEVVGRRQAYYKRASGQQVDSLTMKRLLG